jgi:hypothetical protein
MQAGNKMQVPKKALRYHQEEFSFKGGSHLGNSNISFFLASPISGTRFLLRVVVCNIPRFYQILGEFFLFILLVLIENSQGFKTFEFI